MKPLNNGNPRRARLHRKRVKVGAETPVLPPERSADAEPMAGAHLRRIAVVSGGGFDKVGADRFRELKRRDGPGREAPLHAAVEQHRRDVALVQLPL